MRQIARVLAFSLVNISQAVLMPIDKFVDWLEGAYAGPIDSDQPFSR